MEPPEISRFREYLRIPSVQPDVDYAPCIKFLTQLANEVELPYTIIMPSNKPVFVMTFQGSDPSLQSILLNSHMDVVPVFKERWKYDPFSAEKDSDGNIYGRGSQDMKSVGMQHYEAIRRIKNKGLQLKRTVHISYVPDEEIGGQDGMMAWSKSDDFKERNIGFGIDESGPFPFDSALIFDSEKASYAVKITATGTGGHGSLMFPNTAGDKMRNVISSFMDRRTELFEKTPNPVEQGRFLSINLTQLEGGVQHNVVPPQLSVTFDCRLGPDCKAAEFTKWVETVCKEAGEGVYPTYLQTDKILPFTPLDESNIFWEPMKLALDAMNFKFLVTTAPGGTDARFLREQGIYAIGFSPLPNTPVLLHEDNEHIKEEVFMKGIDIFEKVVEAIANV